MTEKCEVVVRLREREVLEERYRWSQRLQTKETEQEDFEGSFWKISCNNSSYKLFSIFPLSLCVCVYVYVWLLKCLSFIFNHGF